MRAVAYRMLGSLSEADAAAQEPWLRVSRADSDGIETLRGWLTTVVARMCLNIQQSRRSRLEDPLGPHVLRRGRIVAIDVLADPERLQQLDVDVLDD